MLESGYTLDVYDGDQEVPRVMGKLGLKRQRLPIEGLQMSGYSIPHVALLNDIVDALEDARVCIHVVASFAMD